MILNSLFTAKGLFYLQALVAVVLIILGLYLVRKVLLWIMDRWLDNHPDPENSRVMRFVMGARSLLRKKS